jgi:L-threonylcarbamoyladenylate synthase
MEFPAQDGRDFSRISLIDTDTEHAVAWAAAVLRDGGVVLAPTDTVYGLVCLPESRDAVDRIFAMKQRPSDRRMPIIVADLEQAEIELSLILSPAARALARAFWPGAVTIACGVRQDAEGWLAGRDEAAVRAPNHQIVQALARLLGPLLMTSANRHGDATPHTMEGAIGVLSIPPALALDGGTLSGAPSTLVNVNLPVPVIERAGVIPTIEIEQVLNDI